MFLDDDDKKQILVRATGRVQELDTCGISASKRFAFYDQVHTTGMDIQHALDATAVLTLGKDMNFRDYVQGAFRMRQIGQGQKVELYIIPEVAQLIEREVTAAGMATTSDQMLEQVTAWLVISSMRSERVQNNQLMVQNVANVWRKAAFRWCLSYEHLPGEANVLADALSRQHMPQPLPLPKGALQHARSREPPAQSDQLWATWLQQTLVQGTRQ